MLVDDQQLGATPVNGEVSIKGVKYRYTNGILKFGGANYAVSSDHDFIINDKKVSVGAIINGKLVAIKDLTPQQYAQFGKKYGFGG